MDLPQREDNSDRIDALIDEITGLLKEETKQEASVEHVLLKIKDRYQYDEEIPRERIKKLIEKHPFFKNPNHYYIRLITIMKYLKKKGINVRTRDIDLIVDEIIMSIDGVKRVGEDRYALKK